MFENRRSTDLMIESMPIISYNLVVGIKFVNGMVNRHKVHLVITNNNKAANVESLRES